jgi:hypothetical protein
VRKNQTALVYQTVMIVVKSTPPAVGITQTGKRLRPLERQLAENPGRREQLRAGEQRHRLRDV